MLAATLGAGTLACSGSSAPPPSTSGASAAGEARAQTLPTPSATDERAPLEGATTEAPEAALEEPMTEPTAPEGSSAAVEDGFSDPPPAPAVAPSRAEARMFAEAANALAFDLYRQLRGAGGNLVFSPASVEAAFAMAAAGARGDTADEMNRALHIRSPEAFHRAAGRSLAALDTDAPGRTLRIVSRLFGERRYRFEDEFLRLTGELYRAPLAPVDFAADPEASRRRINAWVARRTEGRVPELLPEGSIDSYTRLVIANAVYFLGRWLRPFAPHATQPAFFYAHGRERAAVPTMHQRATFGYGERPDMQVLRLPYEGEELSMVVLLPRDQDGLGSLEAGLDAAALDGLIRALRPTTVQVALPKFTIRGARLDLPVAMKALGMRLAFDPQRADFTGIGDPADPQERLHISAAVHEAFLEVDEAGTEAAAATAVVAASRGAAIRRVPEFNADHPFVFVIRHEPTGAILFVGRVVDPRS